MGRTSSGENDSRLSRAWAPSRSRSMVRSIDAARHFYVYKPPRDLDEIEGEIETLEGEIAELLEGLA
ncbi:ABC transporter C-terminal domain-containing protein [Paracoccus sanguinis]|uniref:ABC transporter C-terminal domain-containing protein n=1 Tax=Paracoccus sanguinis TaxID=1545044 RepID=UPI001B3B43DC|nr:ABC transporter C-terminal domain-containing protein [Paracoccus sanguinis]